MKKYKFNKKIFQVCLALTLILLGTMLIMYEDYKEYTVTCNEPFCYVNETMFKDMHIIEENIKEGYLENEDWLGGPSKISSGDMIKYSNYEEEPFLVKNFLNLTIIILIIGFLINHIWYLRNKSINMESKKWIKK